MDWIKNSGKSLISWFPRLAELRQYFHFFKISCEESDTSCEIKNFEKYCRSLKNPDFLFMVRAKEEAKKAKAEAKPPASFHFLV